MPNSNIHSIVEIVEGSAEPWSDGIYFTLDITMPGDVSLDNKSVKTQLFAAYPRTPYKIGPGETVNFKHTFTVSESALAGRYRIWGVMWKQDLKKWAGPYNKKGKGGAAYMEVVE